jgi:putative restriction endonuclease
MRYWWVNQNQTYEAEVGGGYIWSPKRNRNGARNQFYENMREVSPGDLIFSFRNRKIGAIGIASSNCYEASKPDEFGAAGQNWEQVGWRADVSYTEMHNPITPKEHIEEIRPMLPEKYSPLQQNGDGLQSVYLAEVNDDLANMLMELLQRAGNDIPDTAVEPNIDQVDILRSTFEGQLEKKIRQSTTIGETEKSQLVKSRRGQGKFRRNVRQYEERCRITGIEDVRFLISSHIKPWRSSTNQERLDGENGLMLTPNADSLFDRGFFSFGDDGTLLISPVVDEQVLLKLGVPVGQILNVGQFTDRQKSYLTYHRRSVFLKAGSES